MLVKANGMEKGGRERWREGGRARGYVPGDTIEVVVAPNGEGGNEGGQTEGEHGLDSILCDCSLEGSEERPLVELGEDLREGGREGGREVRCVFKLSVFVYPFTISPSLPPSLPPSLHPYLLPKVGSCQLKPHQRGPRGTDRGGDGAFPHPSEENAA